MKIRLMVFNILIILFFSNNLYASWFRTFDINHEDFGRSVQQTTDGGYIIAGKTWGYGFYNFFLIKTNVNGYSSWIKIIGKSDCWDEGYSVQQTTDGGYIVTGNTNYNGYSVCDVWLIKTDSNGDTLWTKTYGGTIEDWGQSVQQTTDGGYIVVGFTESFGAGSWDVWLIKTDSNGDTFWTRTYGGSSGEVAYSGQQTRDGGYIITGFTSTYGAGHYDVWLVKTDSNGNALWTRTFGGVNEERGYSVQQTADNGYIIVGYTLSFGAGDYDVWLIKTDSNGDTLWTRTYGSIDDDRGYSVQQTTDGGYIITGYTESYAGWDDILLIKTDSNGDTLWTRTYGGVYEDKGYSVQQATDGGYIITGFSETNEIDVCLVKTDSLGYCLGVYEESIQQYPEFLDISVENLSSGDVRISFIQPNAGNLNFSVFDLSGRMIDRPLEGFQAEGGHSITLTGYRPGVYFYRMRSGEEEWRGKFQVY